MNAGHDERLEAVTQDLHALLERRLGNLLGQVQAAQSIARQVRSADDDIARKAAVHDRLVDAGHEEHAALLAVEVEELLAIRESLVESLSQLTSELNA
jgi:hypothetical protein